METEGKRKLTETEKERIERNKQRAQALRDAKVLKLSHE
jgi:hypothetical protein